MNDDDDVRIDREASDAIKRMGRQRSLDGKLDKAYAMEGAAVLFAPLVLGLLYVVGSSVKAAGADGATHVILSVVVLFGLGGLVLYLGDRK